LIAFGSARDAVTTAAAAQRAINAHPWPERVPIRVRMGLHTGEPVIAASSYVGLDIHRAARIMAAGYGGQILLSQATHDVIEHNLPEDLIRSAGHLERLGRGLLSALRLIWQGIPRCCLLRSISGCFSLVRHDLDTIWSQSER
jgi:class 3 adenylate cyclase